MNKIILKDICEDIQYGYTTSAKDEEVGPKCLRITDIVPDLIDWKTVPYCKIEETELEKYALHNGDIVIARTGATTGYAKYLKNPPRAIFASYLIRIKIKDGIDKRFIAHILQSKAYKDFIKTIWGGAAQPNANAQVLTSFPILLPDISIQRKISNILSAYDDLIENNARRIKILEEIAQRIYQEWFVNFRFPGYKKVKFVKSEMGKIPEGWEVKQLKNYVDFIRGIEPGSENYSNTYKNGYLPFLRVGDMGSRSSGIYISLDLANKKVLEEADIAVSLDGTPGLVKMGLFGCYSTGIRKLSIKDSSIKKSFLYFLMLSECIQGVIKVHSKGTTILHASEAIEHMDFLLSRREIIISFDKIAEPMIQTILTLNRKNRILRKSRDILLPKLFSGEIDVSDLDIAIKEQ